MKNSVSDKKGGEHVYGIMQVPKQDSAAKNHGRQQKKYPQKFILPKYQCRQKRQTGVAGKKQVFPRAGRQPF